LHVRELLIDKIATIISPVLTVPSMNAIYNETSPSHFILNPRIRHRGGAPHEYPEFSKGTKKPITTCPSPNGATNRTCP